MARPTEMPTDLKGVSTYNSMLALDGSLKQFCTGCGGPRDVEYAKTNPCFCCGALGTQKTQPVFDEFGELVPAEVVAQQRAAAQQERTERLVAANKARREQATPVAEQPKAKPVATKAAAIPAEKARTSDRQPNAQVLPKPKPETKQPNKASLAALFL